MVSPYSVIAAVIAAGGTGYTTNDVLTLSDGTAGVHAVAAQVTAVGVTAGVVTSVMPATLGSYSVMPSSPVSVTGGTGTGCTLTPTWAALYAMPSDLQQQYDWREIGDLISDSNEQISALVQVTLGNVYNSLLLQFLAEASGEMESSLFTAGMYSTTDLSGLTGNSLARRIRICCEIVIAYIYERKPLYNPDRMKAYRESSDAQLARLASGKNVFNLPLIITAGAPEAAGPTSAEYRSYNLLTDRAKGYPARRLPYNR